MFGFLGKFLDSNEKELSRFRPLVEKINSLEESMQKLSDEKLAGKTDAFRQRLKEGETLDDLLPEACAVIREAIKRTVGERAFDVQLMAAMALHEGKIAEQKTGEGKTLSAVIAVYLNALPQKGVHIVTVNDYLARRDAGWYGVALHRLGLTVASIIHEQAFQLDPEYIDQTHIDDERLMHLRPITRQQAYLCDVLYGTNNEFGFDYLRDNMRANLSDMVQRGHIFAIVDEVDSILIDEARTPLIISAPAEEGTEKYYQFAKLIERLHPSADYTVDEKLRTANLTETGIVKIEQWLHVDNLYEKDFETVHHIEEALKANVLFQKDRDYVVKDDQVIIVDEFTGRLMPGRRYSEGLHQAIEAKEGVAIQRESRTLATISFQNYFRMYEKLAGMTGTAATESQEFHEIYKLDVVIVPTNKPMVREDLVDVVYKTTKAKFSAVADAIEECYKKGRPVLIGTTSIDKNELVATLLKRRGVPHQVLNAKNHEREAAIIAQAGQKGAVTVATNIAGRGVDIKLGKDVVKLGGLHIIGTDRHESRRVDNQLRGRSGRQGDPGSSRFYVSLEDDIMRLFGGDQVARVMSTFRVPENTPLEHPMVSKIIEQAQIKVETFHFDARKHVVQYDDVMNKQREIVYKLRRKVLEVADREIQSEKPVGTNNDFKTLKAEILKRIDNQIELLTLLHTKEDTGELQYGDIVESYGAMIPFDAASKSKILQDAKMKSQQEFVEFLRTIAHTTYDQKEKQIGEEEARFLEKFVLLSVIDSLWVEHLDSMEDMQQGIGLQGYAQRDPLVQYKSEAFRMFELLMDRIDFEIAHRIYRVGPRRKQPLQTMPTNITVSHPQAGSPLGGNQVQRPSQQTTVRKDKKVGRNDPCPCGSGKKYKKCHYPQFG